MNLVTKTLRRNYDDGGIKTYAYRYDGCDNAYVTFPAESSPTTMPRDWVVRLRTLLDEMLKDWPA